MKLIKAKEKQVYRELAIVSKIVDIWKECTGLQIDINASPVSISALVDNKMFSDSCVAMDKAKEYFKAIESDCKDKCSKDLKEQIEFTKDKLHAKYKFC